jgi:threonylcarbamoyladenosine tRNA methylthiotransferase CDKAL1
MNQGEGRELAGSLIALGHQAVDTEEEADLVLVNTCAVIDATERKILRSLHALAQQNKHLVITGCMAAVERDVLIHRFPEALIVPIADYGRFAELVQQNFGSGSEALPSSGAGCTGIVPISQGCLGNCTYCITKLARGTLSSYPLEQIVETVQREVEAGAKEIQVTAQDTGCYGLDLGTNLPALLESVCAIPGSFKVRVGMMNPDSLGVVLDETVAAFKKPKVFKFLHLPVQTGSDRLLRAMGRGYDVMEFEAQVAAFRRSLDRLTLSTDIITGFPGETDEDHRASMDLVRRVKPNIVNVTRFSPRPGTVALSMKGQVVSRISKDRSREVAKLRFEVARELNRQMVGQRFRVLATEVGKNGSTICRDDCYVPIVVRMTLPLGRFYDVEVKECAATHLVGSPV